VEHSCASTARPAPRQCRPAAPAPGDASWSRWPSGRRDGCAAAGRLHAPSPLIGEHFEADYVLDEQARLGRGASGAVFR
jgi:hypothetical protein